MRIPALFLAAALCAWNPSEPELRAGAASVDVSPEKFPVIVNGSFRSKTASQTRDPIFSRAVVLDDGSTRIALAVVDSLMIPRELLDDAKERASKETGIPSGRMMISATHTHSAPSAMGCLGTDLDPEYAKALPGKIAASIIEANKKRVAAEIGWTTIDAPQHTNNRRWILRPDKMRRDPFGDLTVRAHMHPGYQNPDFVGPSGPVDSELSLISLRTASGKPLAVFANYSMHYFGAGPVSADYFGRFCRRFAERIEAGPEFVAIMSQGTSGDLHWMDYGKPRRKTHIDEYADAVAQVAVEAYRKIEYRKKTSLDMAEATLELWRRAPDATRLEWAQGVMKEVGDRLPKNHPEIYAREAILLHQEPKRELKLQAIRIGHLGIATMPNEVYAITGLKVKAQSPLKSFTIELANGADGYIPPPEQHDLGGYTTWPARTAGLEFHAEPKILDTVLTLLERVSGKVRRDIMEPLSPASRKVLNRKPAAFWRLGEAAGTRAVDASGDRRHGTFEPGFALYLHGSPASPRAVHFAGGRMKATVPGITGSYSMEGWIWNGMPPGVRAVTGYFFSRGKAGDSEARGDHLGLDKDGQLIFFNGNRHNEVLTGKTALELRTWYHVSIERDGLKVRVRLNGKLEFEGEAKTSPFADTFFLGGRCDGFATFEGKMDEVALFGR